MKFGEVVLKVFEHRTAIDEITLVNIRSMPNLAISSLKPNFGIAFHGDVDATHTSLHPDVHIGTAFSWGEMGVRPFTSIDTGLYMHHGTRGYVLGECGAFVSGSSFGLWSLSMGKAWATEGDYRGFKVVYRVTYSVPIEENFLFNVKGETFTKKQRDFKSILLSLSLRF